MSKKILFPVALSIALLLSGCENSENAQETLEAAQLQTTATTSIQAEETVTTSDTHKETAPPSTEEIESEETADISLSRLAFGMTEEVAETIINTEYDQKIFRRYIYEKVSLDFDENFERAYLVFDHNLEEIDLNSVLIPKEDCLEFKTKIKTKINEIYGLTDDDWQERDAADDPMSRSNEYCTLDNGVEISIFRFVIPDWITDDSGATMGVRFLSTAHKNGDDIEDIPVIPPNNVV